MSFREKAISIAHRALTNNPHSTTKAHVGLTDVQDILSKFDATVDPDADNDTTEGYTVGSIWVNTTAGTAFICVDNSEGAADWPPVA